MIWLLLFGALFKRVVEIPGFSGGSYIDYLTPGVIVMTALCSARLERDGVHRRHATRGVMDRFLVSPVWRGALIVGGLAYSVADDVVQSLIIVGARLAVGAHFPNGVGRRRGPDPRRAACSAPASRRSRTRSRSSSRQEETLIARVTFDPAAADLPLLGLHAGEPRARLDPGRLALQPGELGGAGRPVGGARRTTGRSSASGSGSWRAAAAVVVPRDAAFRAYQRSL